MSHDHSTRQTLNGEPVSTTEEILEGLAQEPQEAKDSNEAASNPELEHLIGSLQDLDTPESPLPLQTLTLEDLAAAPSAAHLFTDVPMAATASVRCPSCGSSNPQSSRFCGMCAAALAGTAVSERSGRVESAAAQPISEPAKIVILGATRLRRSLRTLELVLLSLLTGVVTYQQRGWWQPTISKASQWVATTFGSRAPAPPAVQSSATVAQPTAPAPVVVTPVAVPAKTASGGKSSTAKHAESAAKSEKTSPSAVVQRALPVTNSLSARSKDEERPLPPALQPASGPPALVQLPIKALPPSVVQQSVAAPAQHAAVSQGFAQGALVYKVAPEYPPIARAAHVQGSVVLNAIIAKDGTVQQVRVVRGNPLLVSSATDAVKRWRYRPFLLDGQPIEVETTVIVNFR